MQLLRIILWKRDKESRPCKNGIESFSNKFVYFLGHWRTYNYCSIKFIKKHKFAYWKEFLQNLILLKYNTNKKCEIQIILIVYNFRFFSLIEFVSSWTLGINYSSENKTVFFLWKICSIVSWSMSHWYE